jgi:ABC-type multidrug transport system fused ATPase/permease subunit
LPIIGEIEFENVSFTYDSEDKHILNNVSFKITAGEKIALLGPTGAGKSTIISLLMRFYEPDSGVIRIDGRNISEYSKKYLRRNIGVVLQKPFLFSTTIKDNIAYSDPASEIEEVEDAAKTSKIHEVIEEMFPKSYETVVGEKGVTLSGGQKQRVAIARILLKDPDILVLDDSTSSVDTETEYLIQKALNTKTKGRTTIIITHRITSIQGCDRIIVLDKGRVAEIGTHNELLTNDGFYKKIHNIQLAIENEIKTDEVNGKDLQNLNQSN